MAIARLPKKSKGVRVVVCTQGPQKVLTASCDEGVEKYESFEVEKLEKEKIVDLNGAGDAFVGGFLSAIALDKTLEQAVREGCQMSRVIIQQTGTTFP